MQKNKIQPTSASANPPGTTLYLQIHHAIGARSGDHPI